MTGLVLVSHSAQLAQGLRMIIHTKIEYPVLPRLAASRGGHHDERRRLHAPRVPSGCLTGVERRAVIEYLKTL